jgi:hypothetical protein
LSFAVFFAASSGRLRSLSLSSIPLNDVHGPLGFKYHHTGEANAVAAYLKNQFTAHHMCDKSHEHLVEARIQAQFKLLTTDSPSYTSKK